MQHIIFVYKQLSSRISILFIADILISAANTMKIEKLVMPEVVQSNSSAVLDCQYSVDDDLFTLEWFFNECLVYQWRPGTEHVVSGVLDGRLDSTYRASCELNTKKNI